MKKRIFLLQLCWGAFISGAQNGEHMAEMPMAPFDNFYHFQSGLNSNFNFNISGTFEPFLSKDPVYQSHDPETNALAGPAFGSITSLEPIPMGDIDTQHKPQAKTWFHAGKWWCAIPPAQGGTWIFRLDGTRWTPVQELSPLGSRTDCVVDGDLIHILMLTSLGINSVATLQYDPAATTYKTWINRPFPANIALPPGVLSATLVVDSTGRMWIAADGANEIFVWWSDFPYETWSTAISIANGIHADDICAITKLQGKIGVFWSNQNTGFFGFRTHNDGDSPGNWSEDEIPASQSAIPGNPRMADDHMNLTLSSDGTLYCVAKTNYATRELPELILLVRRPTGTWDNIYPVGEGTQAIVLLNEVVGKIKIVYTNSTNGGQIVYKEAPVCCIIFSAAKVLMGNPGANFNFTSSTHQGYNNEVALVATNQGSPRQIISVLAADNISPASQPEIQTIAYPNPFINQVTFCFTYPNTENYTVKIYDSKGSLVYKVEGTTNANITKGIRIDGSVLAAGVYILSLQTANDKKVLKLLKH